MENCNKSFQPLLRGDPSYIKRLLSPYKADCGISYFIDWKEDLFQLENLLQTAKPLTTEEPGQLKEIESAYGHSQECYT